MKLNCLKRTCLALFGIIAGFQCISAPAASAPNIDFQPKSQNVYAGGGVSLQVPASGEALNYVWQKDGIALANGGRISGANQDTLNIAKTDASDRGVYSCLISNATGTNLATATLTVVPLPSGLLYAETFPSPRRHTNQDDSLTTVGWNPGDKTRIQNDTAGTCNPWIWESGPGAFAYYATTASGTGVSGLPFPSIELASHPGLSLAAEIGAGTNVTACFAVQINGSSWFVSTTWLAIQNRAPYGLASCTQAFTPAATNWKTLTIDGQSGSVGGPAAADLTGSITGAGLFLDFTTEGGESFGNFKISAAPKI